MLTTSIIINYNNTCEFCLAKIGSIYHITNRINNKCMYNKIYRSKYRLTMISALNIFSYPIIYLCIQNQHTSYYDAGIYN